LIILMTARATSRLPGRNALFFIFISVMINMIGFGILMPVMPKLIMDVTGEGLSEAAKWGGLLSLAYALMQFVMMPVMGSLSDRFGRRPVLLGSLAAFSIDALLLALAPSLFVLFIARILAGTFSATYSTANAYIADITPPEKRAANFGLMGAAFGLGFIIGPALGGLIGDEYGHRAPFFAVAALAFCNFLYGAFVLPETNAVENRRKFSWRRANVFGSFRYFSQYPSILPIAFAIFLFNIGHWAFPAVWAYFAEERFAWTPREIGFSLMAVGLASAVVQGGLTRIIIPKIGERSAAIGGFAIAILAYAAYGLATEGWMIYATIAFGALSGVSGPALQGIMSRTVPADAQGQLQGAMGAITGVSMIIGPLLMTQIFSYFSDSGAVFYLPGAPFLVAAALSSFALLPLRAAFRRIQRPRATTSA
jgi:DHA1 family tetracycline resistance protein-like MFS transporter